MLLPYEPENIKITISMLGGFELRCGDRVVGDSSNRAHQLWNVLEYLVAFRKRDISHEELTAALWPDDESDNPSNALKNLIYRIRTTLADSGIPGAKDLIVYRRGQYSWNNHVDTVVDTERFESLIRTADVDAPTTKRIEAYLEAIRLYQGDFLPKSSCEGWVIPLAAYFHGLYIKCVVETAELLAQQERHEEAAEICKAAVVIDPYEEGVQIALLRAFIAQGNQQKALSHYEYVTELFYRELGVRPSEGLRGIYREIVKNVSHVETDLEVIKEDLREATLADGAFFCNYEIFKKMYQLEARTASRSGQAIFVALLTITDENRMPPEKKLLNAGMDRLFDSARESLRKGDVISRFSATQYVLMLPTLTYENGVMVLDRIAKRFKRDNPRLPLLICTNLQPVDPVVPPDEI